MQRPQQWSAEESAAELRRRPGRIFDRCDLDNQRPRRSSSAADQLDHYRYERRYDDELHLAEHGSDGDDDWDDEPAAADPAVREPIVGDPAVRGGGER
jgi:hypothetical protein